MKKFYLIALLLSLSFSVSAQYLSTVREKLDSLVGRDSTYRTEIDISSARMPISEMLRNVALANGLNINIRSDEQVSCNFSRARIDDLIYFLCSEYVLNVEVYGNILTIYKHTPPPVVKDISISYDTTARRVSYNLTGDNIIDVTRQLSLLSGVNILVPQSIYNRNISGFINRMPLDDAISTLATTNELEVRKIDSVLWEFSTMSDTKQKPYTRRSFATNQLTIDSLGLITATITSGNVGDIIVDLCSKFGHNYFFVKPISHNTSVFVRSVSFETLLNVLLTGTSFSYYIENKVYMFGAQDKDTSLFATRNFRMQHRTVTKIVDVIPQGLKNNVQVQPFADLNSIIISGDSRDVARVGHFLESIDERVPMITMDIMIVDVTKSVVMEAGITMGFGEKPVDGRTGTLSSGINMNFGASSINKLINSFNGLGVVNLGKVADDFYANLKFLEGNGNIELRSTPKLSTLNGHEAMMKSGETKYYKEILNNIIGSQNPIQSESFTWKSVEANLSITITPIVSRDNQITLDVEIEQSEFMAREEKDAPPGVSTRKFKSIVRVHNEDMILLGGLERNSRDKSASGVPFISRIPVLKWIFGTTKDNKSSHKLNIFIKPTLL